MVPCPEGDLQLGHQEGEKRDERSVSLWGVNIEKDQSLHQSPGRCFHRKVQNFLTNPLYMELKWRKLWYILRVIFLSFQSITCSYEWIMMPIISSGCNQHGSPLFFNYWLLGFPHVLDSTHVICSQKTQRINHVVKGFVSVHQHSGQSTEPWGNYVN